ncbi:phosphatase PAP2 family protein [Sphingobacterium zeae]|uniref:Membrane-associated phospholipid phosphatase n=1 Tax=Sphingobacterium zeae TaxID=1776859 RepID=A0ABU0U6W2_9SPHI|nr:phosphatase PAP2 family protein [Sphingobacterium zeae]MDQ1149968.1 membrane-associated phospholipid phosphatase [Sphingobacterium zeae]
MKRLVFIFVCWLNCSYIGALAQETPASTLDIQILESIVETRTVPQTQTFKVLSDINNYVQIAVPVGLLVAGAVNDDKIMRQNALYVASSTAVTALVNVGLKHLFKRSRPFKKYPNFVSVRTASGYSFPSGHTSSAFATASALSRAYSKWYVVAPSLLWASSVGYSRMYLGVHFPTDVLAGAALGTGAAFALDGLKR